MLVLLCAVTIGQIEDVATLRDRYEKARASYEKLQESYDRSKAAYEESQRRASTTSEIFAGAAILGGPKTQALRDRFEEQRIRLEQMQEEHRRRMADHLRQLETFLRRFKQNVDSLKWQYERAAGWPSQHWA